ILVASEVVEVVVLAESHADCGHRLAEQHHRALAQRRRQGLPARGEFFGWIPSSLGGKGDEGKEDQCGGEESFAHKRKVYRDPPQLCGTKNPGGFIVATQLVSSVSTVPACQSEKVRLIMHGMNLSMSTPPWPMPAPHI